MSGKADSDIRSRESVLAPTSNVFWSENTGLQRDSRCTTGNTQVLENQGTSGIETTDNIRPK